MKILIIDDSPESVTIARSRLLRDGLEVVGANSGSDGLVAVKQEAPDLILLDIDMPDKSGFEVCRALKGNPGTSMIPIIFLTGSDSRRDIVKGLDLGAVDYITKPFNAFELRARVRAALRTKHLQDLLIEHARLDPLTELPNRRAMNERLQMEWSRIQRHGGSLSFIMADIDRFKHVNDMYGHTAGDLLLQRVAKTIAKQCRQIDFPSRYGGEEFAIIVPHSDASDAAQLAERCRQEIEAISVRAGEKIIRTTASFGVADAMGIGPMENLIRDADTALYGAKGGGRNRVELFMYAAKDCRDPPEQSGCPIGLSGQS